MTSKMRIVNLNPKEVLVPDVRVTSKWEPELLEMFRQSMRDMGMQSPIIVVEEKGKSLLVDGLHRLEAAKLNNTPKIQAAMIPGTMKDVHLKNLVLNRLRGKTPPTQMAKVCKELQLTHNMSVGDIAQSTGLRREYVDQMFELSKAQPEVLASLDEEEIPVGVAWNIARVQDRDVQLRLLAQARMYRLKVQDCKEIVDETLEILKRKEQAGAEQPTTPPPQVHTVKCKLCQQDYLPSELAGVVMCRRCYGLAYDYIQERIRKREHFDKEAHAAAEKAAGDGT